MSAHPDRLARMADEDLLRLAAELDADAFEVVLDRHADAAFALAHRICGVRATAEDACQEAFVAAWRSAARFDARAGSVRGWLLTIVHNRSIDQVRRATRLRDRTAGGEDAAALLPSGDDTQAAALAGREREETAALLATLPAEQRRVVELAFFSGYTHTEIAELTAVPLGTVKGRMRMALARLRDHLEETAR
jgi:RNA polymerase sigma-70 factor (ECF subfamily)